MTVSQHVTWKRTADSAICNLGDWTANVVWGSQLALSLVQRGDPRPSESIRLEFSPKDSGMASPKAPPLTLGDSYTRQNDFVVQFPERDPWRFGYQVYFCARPQPEHQALAVMELWISVQTSTLESHPQVELNIVGSTLAATQRDMPRGLYASSDHRFGFIVHPLDIDDCVPSRSNSSFSVFGRFMEKGVIRRMRCQVAAASHSLTADQWTELVDGFTRSPLPLTA
jgi:hypothetical protein